MYIEILEDVVQNAIDKHSYYTNDSLDLLVFLAAAVQYGKHFVYVPCLGRKKELCEQLSTVLSKSNVAKLRCSESRLYELKTIKNLACKYAVITYDSNLNYDERVVVINPTRHKSFEPYVETQLLTENLNDASFFRYLAKFFMRQNRINCCICFHALMGGGGTTSDVLMKEVDAGQYFCLVISDSDRKTPDSEVGDTAQKIQKVMDTYHPFNCGYYMMETVMEVENLIPRKIISQYFTQKGWQEILNIDYSFFDMKKGLTYESIYSQQVYDYWVSRLGCKEVCFKNRNDAVSNSLNKEEYLRYVKGRHFNDPIKDGFGNDMLSICTCQRNKNGCAKYPNIIDAMNNVTPQDLSPNQLQEWSGIGRIVFSWTCSMGVKRA